ncbi:MAG: hypothetical protein NTW32_13855 [Chloroflexi bacterium]|nr:hypothetical protein [Chloroflexota bacterium]
MEVNGIKEKGKDNQGEVDPGKQAALSEVDPIDPKEPPIVLPQPAPVQKIISNMTARRISIKGGVDGSLIIPSFGSIILDENALEKYPELKTWEQRNLVTNQPVPANTKEDDYSLGFGCLGFMAYFFSLIIIRFSELVWAVSWGSTAFWIITGILLLSILIVGIQFWVKRADETTKLSIKQYFQWFLLLPSLILVVSIGLGMPVGVGYFFGGGAELLSKNEPASLLWLGRILQLGFIFIASTLPALMYYLFSRQQLDKLHTNFIREVMMLDPNVQTVSEARTKYNPLFDSVHADKTPLDSIPIFFSTILITLGWIMTLLPIGQSVPNESKSLVEMLTPHITTLNFGFLGAYFFTVDLIFRRYVRSDITTKTYTMITIRLVVTAILVWVTGSLLTLLGGDGTLTRVGTLVLAFFIGIVPETGLAILQDIYRKALGGRVKSLGEDHPLTNLEGINLYDRANLLEQGIENIENLAHHNLLELLVKTHIHTPRIVDLFDQAILYLHLGLKPEELLETRQFLRKYGIRTATDLILVEKASVDILKSELPPELFNRLMIISTALSDDEWMGYIKHWRHTSTSMEIYGLESFITGEPQGSA